MCSQFVWSPESGSLKHKTPTSLDHAERAAIAEADKQLSLKILFSTCPFPLFHLNFLHVSHESLYIFSFHTYKKSSHSIKIMNTLHKFFLVTREVRGTL